MKKESTVERSSSLGSTIATIGSVLIAVGFAWLIADNWNVIPDILKVFILLFITAAALIGGVLFRNYDYYKIGSSLIVLGSLLFTLTIFLIAQIYHLSTGIQGNAWLLLICWIGVLLIAYSLDSSSSLIIPSGEFISGEVKSVYNDRMNIQYGIEQFFFERGAEFSARNITVKAKVSSSGQARIVELLQNGEPLQMKYKQISFTP